MDPQVQKEQFNYAYVCAMAAQAGLNRVDASVDDDSVDVSFKTRGFRQRSVRNPQIDFQLKCTSQELIHGDELRFPLSRKNYDDLRGDDVVCPRYLAVLVVPEDVQSWIENNNDSISLLRNCYWVSLRDAEETQNTNSVTVRIPLAQRLTSQVMRQMIERASEGESL